MYYIKEHLRELGSSVYVVEDLLEAWDEGNYARFRRLLWTPELYHVDVWWKNPEYRYQLCALHRIGLIQGITDQEKVDNF